MVSISSLKLRQNAAAAAKAALEAAVAAFAITALAAAVWNGPGEARAIIIGLASAWLVSSLSSSAILLSRALEPVEKRTQGFWLAFGGGMALRLAAITGLMIYSHFNDGVSQPALLMAYALGVLALLIIEYRHITLPAISPERIIR